MALAINSTKKLLSGNSIPIIGFGTYSLKGKVCEDAVKAALQAGYRHIDTGSIFKNEADIKNAMESLSIPREQVFLSSKVGPAEQGYESSKSVCENIMKNFGTDYLDMVLIHWPGSNKCTMTSQQNKNIRLDTWKGLMELKSKGKIRNIGVSNFMVKHLETFEQQGVQRPQVNQFEVHPLLWQKELIDYCRQKGIVVEAYSPIGKGDKRVTENQTLAEIAKKYNKTVAQICLRWVLQHKFITIPRSKNPEHIKENINIFDFNIEDQDIERINELTKNNVRINWDGNKVLY